MLQIDRPMASEFAPYYQQYIQLITEGDVLGVLERQTDEALGTWGGLDEKRALLRYAPNKWSVKQVVGHVVDTERVFSLRALWFARGDPGPLPSMEQESWVPLAGFDARPLADLAEEYRAVRRATLLLFQGLDAEAYARRGIASGKEITVRAFPWLIAGHERHHLRVLQERYLKT